MLCWISLVLVLIAFHRMCLLAVMLAQDADGPHGDGCQLLAFVPLVLIVIVALIVGLARATHAAADRLTWAGLATIALLAAALVVTALLVHRDLRS